MDKTLTDKLNLLINTKTKIQTAITEGGVTVPAELPFNDYDDLIRQLSQVSDTTSTQDLLVLADMMVEIGNVPFIEHTYTEEEISEIEQFMDKLLGEGGSVSE